MKDSKTFLEEVIKWIRTDQITIFDPEKGRALKSKDIEMVCMDGEGIRIQLRSNGQEK